MAEFRDINANFAPKACILQLPGCANAIAGFFRRYFSLRMADFVYMARLVTDTKREISADTSRPDKRFIPKEQLADPPPWRG